jgi:hypothetical protein
MSIDREVLRLFESRAESGDGLFAIAVALHELVHAAEDMTRAVNELGFGNVGTGKGAIEGGFMMLSDAISDASSRIADAIEEFDIGDLTVITKED